MELLFAETDRRLVRCELDLCWITKAGADPFTYCDMHPGRFPLCHVKEMATDGSMEDVNSGTIDFSEIFTARHKAGFRHYYVEYEDPPYSLQSAANSFIAVSELQF